MTLRGAFTCLVAAFVLSVGSVPLRAQPAPGPAPSPAPAPVTPGKCTGHFVNPITDICWSCLFPLSVGTLSVFPSTSGRKDPPNPDLPVCVCGNPVPRIGIASGFWEPVRLADVTTKPWCFPNLGGIKISPGFGIGDGTMDIQSTNAASNNVAKWNVHWYIYPVLYALEVLTDFACFEAASFDIAYVTEIDPLWNDDSLSTLISPEAAVFANPLAQAACAGDCIAASAKLPLDPLFWCAGCQGSMYPLSGFDGAATGPQQSARLILSRFAYKLHRQALALGTMGSKALCNKYVMPIMRKQQYRFQATQPVPSVKGRYACPPIGASDQLPGTGKYRPVVGNDLGYLVWRKRNCCVL